MTNYMQFHTWVPAEGLQMRLYRLNSGEKEVLEIESNTSDLKKQNMF